MTTRARRILDATMELTLRPQQGDRKKIISAVIRAVAEEVYFTADVELLNEIAKDLEALDELAQENPQVPLDAL